MQPQHNNRICIMTYQIDSMIVQGTKMRQDGSWLDHFLGLSFFCIGTMLVLFQSIGP